MKWIDIKEQIPNKQCVLKMKPVAGSQFYIVGEGNGKDVCATMFAPYVEGDEKSVQALSFPIDTSLYEKIEWLLDE